MSPEKIVFIIAIIVVSIFVITAVAMKLPKRLKQDKFYDKWKQVQGCLSDKNEWRQAIIQADDMLAEALKKKKIKGGTTGERLVSAQKIFSDNDSVWYGHKLRSKVEADESLALKQDEVKRALLGIGQALKDLGAL